MRSYSTLWSAVLATGLVAAGCRPKPETTTASPTATTTAPAATSRRTSPPPAVAPAQAPIDLLPERTGVVVSAASVRHLLRVVDVGALIGTYRPYYEQAGAYLEQTFGHNLLDPARWPEIGIDPERPIGVALLDAGSASSCYFISLTDPSRFRAFLDRVGAKLGGSLESVYEDRGIVLAHESGVRNQLVLRDDFAFLVLVGNPKLAPYDFARELASVDPARGLTASPRWQQAMGRGAGRDVVAFIDVGGMVRGEIDAARRFADQVAPSWAEQELQRLREQGAAAEEIARWEQVAAEERASQKQRRESRRRELELWGAVFGQVGPIALELSLAPEAITGTARAQMPETALLRRVVTAGAGPPVAITAASERVLFGTGGKLDLSEGSAGLDSLLRAVGKSMDELFVELQAKLGGDPRGALEMLDGTVSFALTAKDMDAMARGGGKEELGFNLALGFKDPVMAAALVGVTMAKIPSSPLGLAGLKVKRGKSRGHVVTVPAWRDVHVALIGSTLTISTDPKFAQQVEHGPARVWEPRLAALAPVVTAPGAAATLLLDHTLLLGMFMVRRHYEGGRYKPSQNQPYWRFPSLAHEALDKVPQSAAYKARLKEWQRLDAKIERAEKAQERRRSELALAAADSLGAMAISLHETPDGLMTEGGQYFGPGGLARTIERVVEGFSTVGTDYSVHEERGRVEQELQEIRVRDIERALGVRAGE
ncbi:hypothetical protein [Nannocystis punicea]|uniref:Uncharacterized protein n=1 Tax=Nannocystis punicea TaxID=2995304 RepID=A0ABY7H1W8_9BACT|nr:hypothetical protein [Nannocystis poenicansa]WAS93251.1 hypothetical protein O0S08_44390 [Nannocystis poenicansa]